MSSFETVNIGQSAVHGGANTQRAKVIIGEPEAIVKCVTGTDAHETWHINVDGTSSIVPAGSSTPSVGPALATQFCSAIGPPTFTSLTGCGGLATGEMTMNGIGCGVVPSGVVGDGKFNNDLVAGQNISSLNGNITAVLGAVNATTDVSAGADVNAGGSVIATTDVTAGALMSCGTTCQVGTGLGVGVAPPATAGDTQINNALGVGVAPPATAGSAQINNSLGVGVNPTGTLGDINAQGSINALLQVNSGSTMTCGTGLVISAGGILGTGDITETGDITCVGGDVSTTTGDGIFAGKISVGPGVATALKPTQDILQFCGAGTEQYTMTINRAFAVNAFVDIGPCTGTDTFNNIVPLTDMWITAQPEVAGVPTTNLCPSLNFLHGGTLTACTFQQFNSITTGQSGASPPGSQPASTNPFLFYSAGAPQHTLMSNSPVTIHLQWGMSSTAIGLFPFTMQAYARDNVGGGFYATSSITGCVDTGGGATAQPDEMIVRIIFNGVSPNPPHSVSVSLNGLRPITSP